MRPPHESRARAHDEAAIWQQVEFGSYAADLALWRELADAAAGPVLELGSGAGRVALHLAEHDVEVIPVERDAGLAAQLDAAAKEGGFSVTVLVADLDAPADLSPPSKPALVIGPLHVIQVLGDDSRVALFRRLAEVMAPGGTIALTIVDESTLLSSGAAAPQILPDMREIDGWVYSSEPLWVQVGEQALTVRRLRERVSPDGRMERTVQDEILRRVGPDRLELEAEQAGLRPAGRRKISSGSDEADSIVVLVEVPT
jgi:SAM-dependent methyltransferase